VFTRRALLATTSLALPLAACGNGQTVSTVTATVVSYLAQIYAKAPSIIPQLSSLGTLASTLYTDITAAATEIKTGIAANVALPFIDKVRTDLQVVSGALSKIDVPTLATQFITAALTLVNSILPLLGVPILAAPAGGQTPEQAMAVLASMP
jgi:hypothetical protein